jgi:hypothetical protein
MRSILLVCVILVTLGCTKSNDLEDIVLGELDSTEVCIHSLEQLKMLNSGLDTFNVIRVILEDGSEVTADGQNLSVGYGVRPSSGGNSLFDSSLNIRVTEGDVIQTYNSNVWSKGCRNGQDVQGPYTNLLKGAVIYKVNTYFNWIVRPYGAGGPHIKYLVVD